MQCLVGLRQSPWSAGRPSLNKTHGITPKSRTSSSSAQLLATEAAPPVTSGRSALWRLKRRLAVLGSIISQPAQTLGAWAAAPRLPVGALAHRPTKRAAQQSSQRTSSDAGLLHFDRQVSPALHEAPLGPYHLQRESAIKWGCFNPDGKSS